MENVAFAPKEQMLHFHNIFKYVIFQRRQKALLWGKGLKVVDSEIILKTVALVCSYRFLSLLIACLTSVLLNIRIHQECEGGIENPS